MAERYLWPPRPSEAIPFEEALKYYEGRSDWVAQYKFNDSRTVAWFRDRTGDVELWNRHGGRADYVLSDGLKEQLLELLVKLGGEVGQWAVIDCGLLDSRHRCPWLKNKLVIYDVLALNGQTMLGTSRIGRYKMLDGVMDTKKYAIIPCQTGDGVIVGNYFSDDIFVPNDYGYAGWKECWDEVNRVNNGWLTGHGDVSPILEGLVYKYNPGRLDPMIKEKNNSSWMCRSRIATRRHRF